MSLPSQDTLTKQEVFETVAKHLFSQGRQALALETICQYRAPDGTKCAIGVLIRDDEYKAAEMEGLGVYSLCRASLLPERLKALNLSFLALLQDVHDTQDNFKNTEKMRQTLTGVGDYYNLESSFLSKLSFTDR